MTFAHGLLLFSYQSISAVVQCKYTSYTNVVIYTFCAPFLTPTLLYNTAGGHGFGRGSGRRVNVAEDRVAVDLPHPVSARAAGLLHQQHVDLAGTVHTHSCTRRKGAARQV